MAAILGIVSIVLLACIILFTAYQKLKHRECVSTVRLDGKTVIVTGGTAGMGLVIATEMARRGARVIVACPYPQEGKAALEHIIQRTGNSNVHYRELDLGSLTDTRRFAADILAQETRLDILINNAGIGGPGSRTTSDGLDLIMQVNYFGPVLLTLLLLPLLRRSGRPGDRSRIVNVASCLSTIGRIDFDRLSENCYSINHIETYSNSKLCLVMFTRELAGRLRRHDVVVNSLEPGTVGTQIYSTWNRYIGFLVTWIVRWVCKTPWQGAQTTLHVALDEAGGSVSGEYFAECAISKPFWRNNDEKLSLKLWEKTLTLIKLSPEVVEELGAEDAMMSS